MNKSILLVILAVFITIPAMTQDYQQLYQRKIQTYNRMQHAGWSMAGGGGGCALVGGILIATLPADYWSYDDDDLYSDYDPGDDVQAAAGIILICVGVGLMAGGITMGSIGSHKVKSYKSKLNNLSLGIMSTPKAQGLTLTLRF